MDLLREFADIIEKLLKIYTFWTNLFFIYSKRYFKVNAHIIKKVMRIEIQCLKIKKRSSNKKIIRCSADEIF